MYLFFLLDFVSNDTPQPQPRWFEWYTNQTDTPLIKSVNKWVTWYEHVEDPMGSPIWYTDYVGTKDPTPFILNEVTSATSSMTNGIYCIDQTISGDGRSLEYCQKAWLNHTSNPYADLSWYTSIKTITPACNTLDRAECLTRKNNPPEDCRWLNRWKSCSTAQGKESCPVEYCQLEWLQVDMSEDNPCHPFYEYCRGYNPSLYQCDQFFDFCREKLDSNHPGWTYPREYCMDLSISNEPITTCPKDWLKNETNPYDRSQRGDETCYNFWTWTFPIDNSYCDYNPSLTCQKDWLDFDTYDEWLASGGSFSNDKSCREFFDFCRLQLVARYPRYFWPLIDPPTVDDLMPGRCCLATPVDVDTDSIFWGSHVSMIYNMTLN